MAQQTINTGTSANDGSGDGLRTGATKINDNFTELYAAVAQNTADIEDLGGPGGITELGDLTDVDFTIPPADGETIIFDSGTSKWLAGTLPPSVSVLDDLTDVDLTVPPTNGQALVYDTGTSKWIADDVGGATNLAYTASPTNGIVTSDTGTDATIPLVDVTNAGLISPAQNAAITANTAKVSASGSVNTHSDVDTVTVAPVTNDGLVFDGTNFVPVQVWKKSLFSALTYSGSITWDYSTGYNKTLTLTGNTTLALTNFTFGDTGTLVVTQDGTGGRTITFPSGSAYIRGTDPSLMLNTAASATTILRFTSQGSNIWWEEVHSLPLGQKPYTTLTYGATTTVNVSTSNNAKVTLTGNTTIAITGARNGMYGEIIITQGGSGGYVISALPATSKVVEGTSVSNLLSPAVGDITILSWRYDGTTYFWDYGKNFA